MKISNQTILERQAAELALLNSRLKAQAHKERTVFVIAMMIISIALAL